MKLIIAILAFFAFSPSLAQNQFTRTDNCGTIEQMSLRHYDRQETIVMVSKDATVYIGSHEVDGDLILSTSSDESFSIFIVSNDRDEACLIAAGTNSEVAPQ